MFKFPTDELVQLSPYFDHQQPPRTVLFIIAGIEGNCDVFKALAEALGHHDTLVFGLEYTLRVPYTSIKDTARFYIDKIRIKLEQIKVKTLQLAGYSYGNGF